MINIMINVYVLYGVYANIHQKEDKLYSNIANLFTITILNNTSTVYLANT